MILLPHLLLGAVIGKYVQNPALAVILAFLSHYLLDLFPHAEYSVDNIFNKRWRKAGPDFLKVFLDFTSAIILVAFFSNNSPIIYICAFFAILPDGFSILETMVSNKILKKHKEIHRDKIHFLKNKKFSDFWRISSQVLVAIISVLLLRL